MTNNRKPGHKVHLKQNKLCSLYFMDNIGDAGE